MPRAVDPHRSRAVLVVMLAARELDRNDPIRAGRAWRDRRERIIGDELAIVRLLKEDFSRRPALIRLCIASLHLCSRECFAVVDDTIIVRACEDVVVQEQTAATLLRVLRDAGVDDRREVALHADDTTQAVLVRSDRALENLRNSRSGRVLPSLDPLEG